MSAAATMAMAEDMPCCPDEKPAMPDCAKACPLMALCLAKCFQNLPIATALTVPLVATGRIAQRTKRNGTASPRRLLLDLQDPKFIAGVLNAGLRRTPSGSRSLARGSATRVVAPFERLHDEP